jgi:hypothetical protein
MAALAGVDLEAGTSSGDCVSGVAGVSATPRLIDFRTSDPGAPTTSASTAARRRKTSDAAAPSLLQGCKRVSPSSLVAASS